MITFLQTTKELCHCKRHQGWEQKYQLAPLLHSGAAEQKVTKSQAKSKQSDQKPKPVRSKTPRARTINVPKHMKDQLKAEILARASQSPAVAPETTPKPLVSDFVVNPKRSQKTLITKSKSARDLFRIDEHGQVVAAKPHSKFAVV